MVISSKYLDSKLEDQSKVLQKKIVAMTTKLSTGIVSGNSFFILKIDLSFEYSPSYHLPLSGP